MKKLTPLKLLAGLATAAGAVMLAIGALSLPWHGSRPPEPARVLSSAKGSGALRAGAAVVPFTLPAGAPIGGFPRFSWRSSGIRDPVGARALYLEVPGCRVAIVSAEILLVTETMARQVEQRVADLRLDAVLLGATHTHAGPGGYWDDVLAERAALGPYDAGIAAAIADSIVEAIRRAAATAAPARLSVARGQAEPLVRARSRGQLDARMLSLRVASASAGGTQLAELLVFAAHPTTLGRENRMISGDWPGRLESSPRRGLRVLLQGAIGDQSARVPDGEPATRPERFAAAVDRADEALASSEPIASTELAVASATVLLPEPAPGAVPALLRRAASTLAWNRLPSHAKVTALRLGPVRLVAVPAEPTAEIAAGWRAAAGEGSEIASLVGGYVGYVDTAARTRSGDGEAVRTYYGPALAERLESAVVAAARAASP